VRALIDRYRTTGDDHLLELGWEPLEPSLDSEATNPATLLAAAWVAQAPMQPPRGWVRRPAPDVRRRRLAWRARYHPPMATDSAAQAELLGRAGLGDREAFRRFYAATAGQVFGLGPRMFGDRARAEDLLQDVCLRAWYRAADYHPGRGEPLAWLVAIARNRAIDMGRGANERNLSLDAVPEEAAAQVSAAPEDENAKLHRCTGQLDMAQCQSIFCAFFHGSSHGEIAGRFSEPVGTIK
jgi:RNA polymerase sigma-70 factor (ECF subfamily)